MDIKTNKIMPESRPVEAYFYFKLGNDQLYCVDVVNFEKIQKSENRLVCTGIDEDLSSACCLCER